jgi:hypothetical protein
MWYSICHFESWSFTGLLKSPAILVFCSLRLWNPLEAPAFRLSAAWACQRNCRTGTAIRYNVSILRQDCLKYSLVVVIWWNFHQLDGYHLWKVWLVKIFWPCNRGQPLISVVRITRRSTLLRKLPDLKSASELYRPSGSQLSAKLVLTCAGREVSHGERNRFQRPLVWAL